MRTEHSVTSLSWIPSEAVRGGTRVAFDRGFTHYDDPPPDVIEDIEALRQADRFRFANVLSAYLEYDADGTITGYGYTGGGLMGSTTVAVGGLNKEFEAVALPVIQQPPEVGDGWVRFVQTAGGRTGLPARAGCAAGRSSSGRPRWCGPPWASRSCRRSGDVRRPRGQSVPPALVLRRGREVWRPSRVSPISRTGTGSRSGSTRPWGDQDSPTLVTAVETALERALSVQMMDKKVESPSSGSFRPARHPGGGGRAGHRRLPGARRRHPGGEGRRTDGRVRTRRRAGRACRASKGAPGRRAWWR